MAIGSLLAQAALFVIAPANVVVDISMRVALVVISIAAVIAREIGGNLVNQPRVVSEKELDRLTEQMREWAALPGGTGNQSIAVFAQTGTYEAAALADQLAVALSAAGWQISRYPVMYGMSLMVHGVGLLITDTKRGGEVAAALMAALHEANVDSGIAAVRSSAEVAKGKTEEKMAGEPFFSSISLIVGDKP